MAERKLFSFLRSYYEAAQELSKEEQADFFMAICSYALDGIEPDVHGVAAALFKLAKPNIEVSLKRSEAGKSKSNEEQNEASDEQNENKIEQNENKIETNEEQNEANDEQNGLPIGDRIKEIGERSKEKGERKKEKGVKEPRHKHGQYQNVLLSDSDMMKLQAEFPDNWQGWIEKVSEYCRGHGKTYADYLAVIRNWARREKAKPIFSPNARNDVLAGAEQAMRLLGGVDDG